MDMNSTKRVARLAGFLYVLFSIPGIFGLLYMPSVLIVPGNAAETARNIAASEALFRTGVVADLIAHAGFILVALTLYHLLKGVDSWLAKLMVILLVVQVPIVFVSEVYRLAVLPLVSGAGPVAALSEAQRIAHVSLTLRSYDYGMLVDEIFMGAWFFPLGILIFRSGFLPRALGVVLFVAGVAYVAESLTWLLSPAHGHLVGKFASPLRALELAMPLWLLFFGAKDRPLREAQPGLTT
jgi:hypothetical protein